MMSEPPPRVSCAWGGVTIAHGFMLKNGSPNQLRSCRPASSADSHASQFFFLAQNLALLPTPPQIAAQTCLVFPFQWPSGSAWIFYFFARCLPGFSLVSKPPVIYASMEGEQLL
jgi:hypothetical protein